MVPLQGPPRRITYQSHPRRQSDHQEAWQWQLVSAIRNMLQRMGLSLEAANEVTSVVGRNISVLEDSQQLEEKDVKTLCRVIRRPGGTDTAGNLARGMQVLAMAEANLKHIMTYQIHHTVRVSCLVVWTDITLVSIRNLSRPIKTQSLCMTWT